MLTRTTILPNLNHTHQAAMDSAAMLSTASVGYQPEGHPAPYEESGAFELGGDGDLLVPERLLTDWVELILLTLLLGLGLPLNLIALTRLMRRLFTDAHKGTPRQEVGTSFLWLKIHLTIVDLIVILCYCPSHIAWLISYTWRWGDPLCKAMQYSWDFCFHLMSFGVVSVAVDRWRTVYSLMRMQERSHVRCPTPGAQLRFVRLLIASCYLCASLLSVPQWFVWSTVEMRTWSQCTTIWHKVRALQYMEQREFNEENFPEERLYTLVHLISVFWVPFTILLLAYLYIVVYLFYYSLRPYSQTNNGSATVITTTIPTNPGIVEESKCSSDSPQHGIDSTRLKCLGHRLAARSSTTSLLLSSRVQMLGVEPSTTTTDRSSTTTRRSSASLIHHHHHAPPLGARASNGSCHVIVHMAGGTVPAWRVEMRSRMFRTTVHVILAYLVCWLPYNVLALATFFSHELQVMISTQLDVLRVCVLLNTLLNPFIYSFGEKKPSG